MLGSAAPTEDIQVELLEFFYDYMYRSTTANHIDLGFSSKLDFRLCTLIQNDDVSTGLGKNFSFVLVCTQRGFDPVIQRSFTRKLHLDDYRKKMLQAAEW